MACTYAPPLTVPSVAITAMGPSLAAATAAAAPGPITPITGRGAKVACNTGSATEAAVLHATTSILMSRAIRARAACTA